MNEADELFKQNPLKAIWVRLGNIEKILAGYSEEFDSEELHG